MPTAVHEQSQKRYASPAEAAAYFGGSVSFLYRLAKNGRVRQYRIGRRVFFDLEELDALMSAHVVNGNAVTAARENGAA